DELEAQDNRIRQRSGLQGLGTGDRTAELEDGAFLRLVVGGVQRRRRVFGIALLVVLVLVLRKAVSENLETDRRINRLCRDVLQAHRDVDLFLLRVVARRIEDELDLVRQGGFDARRRLGLGWGRRGGGGGAGLLVL